MKNRVFIISLIIFFLVLANFVSVSVNVVAALDSIGTAKQTDYDVSKFKLLLVLGFGGKGGEESTVAYSPCGDKLAVGDATGIIHIIDPQSSYKEEKQLYITEDLFDWPALVRYLVMDISWSPDGKRIAAAYSDRSIKIWDTATGGCIKDFPAHNNTLRSISWSPDGTKIASSSNYYSYSGGERSNDTIKVWDANTLELLKTLYHNKNVCDIAWHPDNSQLASCCDFESSVMIWNASTGKCIKDIPNSEHCRRIAWSPDGTKLITGGDTGNVWDVESRNSLKTFNYSVYSLSISPDEAKIAMSTSNQNGTIEVWGTTEWNLSKSFEGKPLWWPSWIGKKPPSSISWTSDGTKVAIGYCGYVEVYDVTTGGLIISIDPTEGSNIKQPGGDVYSSYYLAWSYDASKLVWGAYSTVTIWDLTTEGLRKLEVNSSVRGTSLSPDGTKIAVASFKNFIELWDMASGECLTILEGYSGPGDPYINDVAWSPKGDLLLASFGGLSYSSGVVQVWNLTTYNCTKTILANTYFVWSVAWNPEGTKFAYDCGPTVKIWDIASDTCVRTFTGNGRTAINFVSWSPDGTKLLYGSDLDKVIVQNLEENTSTILENVSVLRSGSWSPDSTKIVGGADYKLRIWSAASGKLINSFQIKRNSCAVSWSPDGSKIASAMDDTTVRIWGENESVIGAGVYYGNPPPIIVGASISKYICKKSDTLEISGSVVDNTSAPMINANVTIKILETGDEWTTVTDSKGDYSKTIIAPATPGNYTVRVTVTSGNHTGWKQMILAVEEEGTDGGTTNGGQQPSGEENKYGINLNYVIGIVAVITVCVILSVVLVKHRRKQPAKIKEEKKNTITLRCPKCRQTFRVELKTKPFPVKCSHCGKEGEIK